jgi:hypothetical protein
MSRFIILECVTSGARLVFYGTKGICGKAHVSKYYGPVHIIAKINPNKFGNIAKILIGFFYVLLKFGKKLNGCTYIFENSKKIV